MILYLDTSALVKLFIEEIGSREIRSAVISADGVSSSLLAYAEARSAFARKRRLDDITQADFERYKQEFERFWPEIHRLAVDSQIVQRAAELCELHSLRAYDSVHLASAEQLHDAMMTPIAFACFDAALNRAALEIGLNAL